MSASWPSILKRRCGKNLFEVRSAIKGAGRTMGFIVGFSDDLILFHVLGTDTFRLNGYSALRTEDIEDYRDFDNSRFWQNRAARHFNLSPVSPVGVMLTSVQELLASIWKRYPLVTVHPERTRPGVCYIGLLLFMTKATFTIDDLDCNAKWTGPRRLRFRDISRVDFGGGYEEALAVTAPRRPKRKQ